jgi:hypothetical protein
MASSEGRPGSKLYGIKTQCAVTRGARESRGLKSLAAGHAFRFDFRLYTGNIGLGGPQKIKSKLKARNREPLAARERCKIDRDQRSLGDVAREI